VALFYCFLDIYYIEKNLLDAAHSDQVNLSFNALSPRGGSFIFSFPQRDGVKRDFKLLAFEQISTFSRDSFDILRSSPVSLSQ
jgi:hypothetical protein